MKRILISAVAILMLFSVQVSAQTRWGVTGGMNFNTSEFSELDVKARVGWNAGLTCLVDLPLGFSLQPSLVYSQKGTNLISGNIINASQTMGFIELPVSVQWGPDLLIFRPFLDVTPYIGYAVSKKFTASVNNLISSDSSAPDISWDLDKDVSWNDLRRFEYGLGIGGGINVWRIQALVRYCWNFGSLYNVQGWEDIKEDISGLSKESKNFGGLHIGLSFLF